MKKPIKVLAIIALASTLVFFALSFVLAFYSMASYDFDFSLTSQEKLCIFTASVLPRFIFVVSNVAISAYMLSRSRENTSCTADVTILCIRFIVLQVVITAFSSSFISKITSSNEVTISFIQAYSLFNSGFNSITNNFDWSAILIAIALAFSIAGKVYEKKYGIKNTGTVSDIDELK